jgi:hypothetical protein
LTSVGRCAVLRPVDRRKRRARASRLPATKVNGRRCQESTTWAGSAPVRTSRSGEYEQLCVHPLREPPRELKVCWASMLSRSVKMPLNLTDQHAQSDGGKSETPSAGDEPLWRASYDMTRRPITRPCNGHFTGGNGWRCHRPTVDDIGRGSWLWEPGGHGAQMGILARCFGLQIGVGHWPEHLHVVPGGRWHPATPVWHFRLLRRLPAVHRARPPSPIRRSTSRHALCNHAECGRSVRVDCAHG